MEPEDMYVLSAEGSTLSSPSPKPYPNKAPKCTDSADVFLKVISDPVIRVDVKLGFCFSAIAGDLDSV